MSYKVDKYKDTTRIIGISTEELDLDKTLRCGQAFRWNKTQRDYWYGTIGKKLVILKQGRFIDGEYGIATNLDIDDTKELIYYLDLDTDYTSEISKLNLDDYAKKAYEYGKGIHILRQDLFETMVTFLMSQCNSMHNIKLIVDKLSEKYGDKVCGKLINEEIEYYTFPTLERLAECSYDDFMKCSIGFRSKYLVSMLNSIKNNYSILNNLKNCDYNNAMNILTSYDGIGDKVANCISLFGLHHVEAFPIDTHIKRIIQSEYNGNIDIARYGQIAGVIQQYMYYYSAFKAEG